MERVANIIILPIYLLPTPSQKLCLASYVLHKIINELQSYSLNVYLRINFTLPVVETQKVQRISSAFIDCYNILVNRCSS